MATPYEEGAAPASATPKTATPHVAPKDTPRADSGDLFDPASNPELAGHGFAGQEQLILDYLDAHPDKGLTSAEALLELGIGRLASRVSDMAKRGVRFAKVPETHKKAAGRGTARVTRYFRETSGGAS